MSTDFQTLISIGSCYQCAGAVGEAQLLKLGLLVKIANAVNPMAATDFQSLIDRTNCYGCSSNASMGTLFELGLLQIIAEGVSSGGFSFLSGSGSPVGVKTPVVIGQTYLDTTTPAFWSATGLTNTSWVQIA